MGKKRTDGCIRCYIPTWQPSAEQQIYLKLIINRTYDNLYGKGDSDMKTYIKHLRSIARFMEKDCK
jgi:hypothetical protein